MDWRSNDIQRVDQECLGVGARSWPLVAPEIRPFGLPERLLLVKADVRQWVSGNVAPKRLLYARKQTLG